MPSVPTKGHTITDALCRNQVFDLDVKAVASGEDIGGCESIVLIAVEKSLIVAERVHQRGRFPFQGSREAISEPSKNRSSIYSADAQILCKRFYPHCSQYFQQVTDTPFRARITASHNLGINQHDDVKFD